MNNQNLEKEIESSLLRIDERSKEIDFEIEILKTQITKFIQWAWGFVWLGGILGVVGLVFYFFGHEGKYGLNLLGDFMAGAVASVWSLAGLFFIYVAFLGQKEQLLNQQLELMYSRLEVKYTRLELQAQRVEMAAQNETMKQQKFENTFFQLMNIHAENVKSIDIIGLDQRKSLVASGRDCFKEFYNDFLKYFPEHEEHNINKTLDFYHLIYDKNKNDLEHYYRHIYHIIKFVESSTIENKKTYTTFLRAQLSSYELILIFYNGLSTYGHIKMKPLLEKYSLLKNINFRLLINKEHKYQYKPRVFG